MAGQTINMSILKQVIRHRLNGVALQTIAKAVGISRNTVKKYLRLIDVKQLNWQDLLQLDDMVLDILLKNLIRRKKRVIKCLLPFFLTSRQSFAGQV
jgi:predicted transcriptional regulator